METLFCGIFTLAKFTIFVVLCSLVISTDPPCWYQSRIFVLALQSNQNKHMAKSIVISIKIFILIIVMKPASSLDIGCTGRPSFWWLFWDFTRRTEAVSLSNEFHLVTRVAREWKKDMGRGLRVEWVGASYFYLLSNFFTKFNGKRLLNQQIAFESFLASVLLANDDDIQGHLNNRITLRTHRLYWRQTRQWLPKHPYNEMPQLSPIRTHLISRQLTCRRQQVYMMCWCHNITLFNHQEINN